MCLVLPFLRKVSLLLFLLGFLVEFLFFLVLSPSFRLFSELLTRHTGFLLVNTGFLDIQHLLLTLFLLWLELLSADWSTRFSQNRGLQSLPKPQSLMRISRRGCPSSCSRITR